MHDRTLRIFKVDVTPPVGMTVCGWLEPSIGVKTPLELRGVIISEGSTHYILAALDYWYTIGRSHDRFVEALAEGAGIPASQAALHSNHVHDAPVINEQTQAQIDQVAPGGTRMHDEDYFERVLASSRNVVQGALRQPGIPLSGIAFSEHPVEQFASTRRVMDKDGQCHIRWSSGNDPDGWIKANPEGLIDPILSQITFYDDNKSPVACLSFYASHPQVSNGRSRWSADTIGVARDLFELTHPGIFTLYFDGCGGDVTAGKYTSNIKHRDRLVFGSRLFDAMHAAFAKAEPKAFESFGWHDKAISMPLSVIPEDQSHFRAIVESPDSSLKDQYLAALKLRRLLEGIDSYPFRLTRLTLNDAAVLTMPAELIVDYQLYAKSKWPGPLAVAAYGDCFLNYVAIDASFEEGGYEVQPLWTEVGRGIEKPIKDGIVEMLSC